MQHEARVKRFTHAIDHCLFAMRLRFFFTLCASLAFPLLGGSWAVFVFSPSLWAIFFTGLSAASVVGFLLLLFWQTRVLRKANKEMRYWHDQIQNPDTRKSPLELAVAEEAQI